MASSAVVNKPEQPLSSIRELFSSFVRKSSKVSTQQKTLQRGDNSAKARTRSNSCHECRQNDVGYWENEFSTDSFLELSSEVSPIEDDCWGNGIDDFDSKNDEGSTTENGNLWKDEVRRKCAQLTKHLEGQLRLAPAEHHGFNLKFPADLPQRIAKKIVSTASTEPCGLRGCCVFLRLLHEDIADALMASKNPGPVFSKGRAERCASWPEAPNAMAESNATAPTERQALDFRFLPAMDEALTANVSAELITDSGFAEGSEAKRRSLRRAQHSVSSSSIPALPSLSSASRLQVACTDLGRLDLCDPDSVPTFEVYVYLAPATTWTWWVRKFFSSSIKAGKSENQRKPAANRGATRTMSLAPDFTLVKRKLYRSRSNSLQVIRCPEPK